MKKLLFTLALSIPLLLCAQDKDKDYTMFETVSLKPNGKDNTKLTAAMKLHNKTYHSKGAHTARVWAISTGPEAGTLVWMMGPLKYADLDNRPEGDAHDKDWAKVMAYIGSVGTVEYWKRNDELSNVLSNNLPLSFVRYWKVSSEYGFLANGLLKQISATIKAMEGENPWSVYDNEFRQGDLGRHLATVSGMKNWKEIDDDSKFKETFIKVHGDDAWNPFIRSMDIAFEDSYDEIWTIMPKMGGTD